MPLFKLMMPLKSVVNSWRTLSPAARLLVTNGLAFNLGFYMMLPYLAHHLGSTLGLTGWITGLILGIRVFSQQGLFLLGGTLGDRLGYRPAILSGCLIRAFGFALLGWADSVPVLIIAAFLTGFAGALFTPCAQAYLAAECRDAEQRHQAFALHNLASEVGMLLGPLAGLWLTNLSYAATGCISGGIFLLLTILQWCYLPQGVFASQSAPVSVLTQWHSIWLNRPFLRFTLSAAAYPILFHQLYLAIPAYIQSTHQPASLLSSVFVITALIGVMLQLPVTHWVKTRLGLPRAIGIGLVCMGGSYVTMLCLADIPVMAVTLQAVLFSFGSILCYPLFSVRLPYYAGNGQLGSYYGFYASFGGCVALLSNVVVGRMLGNAGTKPPEILWYVLLGVGVLFGWLLYRQLSSEDKQSESRTC